MRESTPAVRSPRSARNSEREGAEILRLYTCSSYGSLRQAALPRDCRSVQHAPRVDADDAVRLPLNVALVPLAKPSRFCYQRCRIQPICDGPRQRVLDLQDRARHVLAERAALRRRCGGMGRFAGTATRRAYPAFTVSEAPATRSRQSHHPVCCERPGPARRRRRTRPAVGRWDRPELRCVNLSP